MVYNNEFLYATKSSISHCSRWHAVSTNCEAADVSSESATKMDTEHKQFMPVWMSEKDRKIFYDHLEHD